MTPTHVSVPGQLLRPGPQPGVQNPFGPVQMRPLLAAPPQSASVEQPHSPVAVMHTGSRPAHWVPFVAEHSVHAPASGPVFWHAGRDGSGQLGPPSAVQGAHVRVAARHTGVVPPQSALPRQLTHTPPPPEVSHRGVAAPQRLVSAGVHTAHAPVGRHSGTLKSQSAPERQPRQVCEPRSQTGRVPAQSALEAHSTQRSVPGSQTWCVAPQTPGFAAAHGTQAPPAHTGAAAPHSASAVQARQVWVAASQTGAADAQSAEDTHDTQRPSAASQRGVPPVQAAAFVTEHAPHAPLG
jgi:hypothetical protein